MGEDLTDPPIRVPESISVIKGQVAKQVEILVTAGPYVEHRAISLHGASAADTVVSPGWVSTFIRSIPREP